MYLIKIVPASIKALQIGKITVSHHTSGFAFKLEVM